MNLKVIGSNYLFEKRTEKLIQGREKRYTQKIVIVMETRHTNFLAGTAAQKIIIPLEADKFSIDGLDTLTRVIESMRRAINSVAFGCKGKDICPSCSTRRMVAAARCWAMLLASHRRRRDRAAIPSMNACR